MARGTPLKRQALAKGIAIRTSLQFRARLTSSALLWAVAAASVAAGCRLSDAEAAATTQLAEPCNLSADDIVDLALADVFSSNDAPRLATALHRTFPDQFAPSITANNAGGIGKQFRLAFPNCCTVAPVKNNGPIEQLFGWLFLRGAVDVDIDARPTYIDAQGHLQPRWILSNTYAYDACGHQLDYSREFIDR
jgi:hypothetical protein